MPTTIARPTEQGVRQRLAEIGLDLPGDSIAGTVANLIVLQDHMQTLRSLVLDDRGTVATDYRT